MNYKTYARIEQLKIMSRFVFRPFSRKCYCVTDNGIEFTLPDGNNEIFEMGLGDWFGEEKCDAHAYNLMDIWNTWKTEGKLLLFRFGWNFGIFGKNH